MSRQTATMLLTVDWRSGPRLPALVVSGAIAGATLHQFGAALEEAARDGGDVMVDVSNLDAWSLLAQAMVLSIARDLAERGGRLVLYGPNEMLRKQSLSMNIFGLITTRHISQWPAHDTDLLHH